ncbi:MAG: septum formation initiator family protein [Treponemataceae bacterium]|nr:septum formation initiator family protein [Treponemataceae bacterium]
MIRMKMLAAAFIGTLAYTAVSFLAGRNGIWGYNQLEGQKKEIARQANAIEAINAELVLEYTALLKDRDVIAAYARKLDYVGEGEKLVKITGLRPYQATLYDTGTVLRSAPCDYISETNCKIIGLVFFLLSLLLMVLFDVSSGRVSIRRERADVIHGIPVYDVPQV